MSFRESGFRSYFSAVASPSSVNSYLSFLRTIDRSMGGLDEAIKEKGASGVWSWAQQATVPPFDTRRSDARSILKRYLGFVAQGEFNAADTSTPAEGVGETDLAASLVFELERNMQAAVRKSISSLEPGIQIVDGGYERSVSTGKIDILAKDADGIFTVIELKAGLCPSGAIEQVLGYAEALSHEENAQVRCIVVASSFSDRQVAASKRISDLKLYTYDYSVSFSEVAEK